MTTVALAKIYPKKIWYPFLLFCAGFGIFILGFMTDVSVGLVNDSAAYLGGAQNILKGHGYVLFYQTAVATPITDFPPFFSLFLASVIGFTQLFAAIDVLTIARWVMLFLFGSNIFLFGLLIFRLTNSTWLSSVAALSFMTAAPLLSAHALVMSEALFLFLGFLFLLSLFNYQKTYQWHWLLSLSLIAPLVFLTRYAGAIYYFGFALFLLAYARIPWRKKIIHGSIFAVLAGSPPVLWLLRNAAVSKGGMANRHFMFHPLPLDKVIEGLNNVGKFIFPDSWIPLSPVVLVVIASVLILVTILLALMPLLNKTALPNSFLGNTSFMASLAIIYLLFLLTAMTFMDACTTLESRILLPFMLLMAMAFLTFGGWYLTKMTLTPRRLVIASLLVMVILSYPLIDSKRVIADYHRDGQGFASHYWYNNATMEQVKSLDPSLQIFSNRPMGIYLLLDKPAMTIPTQYDPTIGQERPDYQEKLLLMRNAVLAGKAVVVVFDYQTIDKTEGNWYQDISYSLSPVIVHSDGIILGNQP